MKASLLAISLLLTISASAAEIKVMEIPLSANRHARVSSVFKINKDLGRAWVEVSVDARSNHEDDFGLDTYRSRVNGLSYDQNTSEIILDVEGQIVVCATVRNVGISIFRQEMIKLTENCSLEDRKIVVIKDNGFERIKETQSHVFIVTK